jgi:hypothetical protein
MAEGDAVTGIVLRLQAALRVAGIPSAFGGDVALACHGVQRTTIQGVDLHVFQSADQPIAAVSALAQVDPAFALGAVLRDIHRVGQARVRCHGTDVDLFFAALSFFESAAARTRSKPFGGSMVEVLSVEDLVVCKALFNRRSDWTDIEQVLYASWPRFRHAYAREWLCEMAGAADQRVRQLDLLVTQVEQWERSLRR